MNGSNLLFVKKKIEPAQPVIQHGTIRCLTCDILFDDSIEQKAHFKSEWHLYNLKRKNAGLQSITFDDYNTAKQQIQQIIAPTKNKSRKRNDQSEKADMISTTDGSSDTIQTSSSSSSFVDFSPISLTDVTSSSSIGGTPSYHVDSQSSACLKLSEVTSEEIGNPGSSDSRMFVVASASAIKAEKEVGNSRYDTGIQERTQNTSIGSGMRNNILPFDYKRCLFDNTMHNSLYDNIKYMEKKYTFHLPEKEYLSDPVGLLRYIYYKIYKHRLCIYCNRTFSNNYAVIHHMTDKQHIKLNDDHFSQIKNYYNFTKSYLSLLNPSRTPSSAAESTTEGSPYRPIDNLSLTESTSSIQSEGLYCTEVTRDCRIGGHEKAGHTEGTSSTTAWSQPLYLNEISGDHNGSDGTSGITPSTNLAEGSKEAVCEDDDGSTGNDWEDLITVDMGQKEIEGILLGYGLKRAYITKSGNLSLPNGREAIHREVAYIYRQNLTINSGGYLKRKQDKFKFKKPAEKRQIIMSQKSQQYETGKRNLKVDIKSYKLFVPVRQDLCFG